MSGIIVDSLIWREYLEKENIKGAGILEKLIKGDKVIICGYTFVGILKDIKRKKRLLRNFKRFSCFILCRDRKRRLGKSK